MVTVVNERGLHARAASRIVKLARTFKSSIHLVRDNVVSDAKSILGVLVLAAPKGTVLELRVEGDDEEEAMEALRELFEKGFYEEDELDEEE